MVSEKKELTCWSCAHLEGEFWCGLNDKPVLPEACDDFEYEPGSDEWERQSGSMPDGIYAEMARQNEYMRKTQDEPSVDEGE